jgi:hypothetical protein
MSEMRYDFKALDEKHRGKDLWEDRGIIGSRRYRVRTLVWIAVAQYSAKWWALVNTVMKFSFQKCSELLDYLSDDQLLKDPATRMYVVSVSAKPRH